MYQLTLIEVDRISQGAFFRTLSEDDVTDAELNRFDQYIESNGL